MIGAQSYSFRQFSFEDSFKQLDALGLDCMEFCSVHFQPDASDARFGEVKHLIANAGVLVPCFGVEGFGADEAANRRKFEFAQALGIGILTADPAPESFSGLDRLCDEFGIKIAIHNHGPGARYDKAADTLRAIQGHSTLIGGCVDTGHAIRSGEPPQDVIEQLGERLISLHLKDWSIGGEEQILGEGDMDLAKVASAVRAVRFSGPVIMEYENSPANPVPEMKQGLANWLEATSGA